MKRTLWGLGFGLAGLLLGGPLAFAAPPSGFQNQVLVQNLTQPTDLAYAPDGRIFITQKTGAVMVYKNGTLLPTPALTLSPISTGGDRGLLSIALDPNFSANGYVYVAYTTADNHERISRFTMTGDTINPASELILLQNPETWSGFLNAVTIRYNKFDGKLYASFGSDGLSSNSQDLSSLSGKLLRINLDGSIPPDNPFAQVQGAQGAIWAYGFRNPWKINTAPDGSVLVGDVGENSWEEVDRSVKGGNFGWPNFEGYCTPNCAGTINPLFAYSHNGNGAAILGGDSYTGSAFPAAYQGKYFFGDYVRGTISILNVDGSGNAIGTTTFDSGLGALSALQYEPDQCLYYLTIFPGSLHRYCYGNVAPVLNAVAVANPPYGPTPLSVQFSGSGSSDSSGTALSYLWNFGDGATSTSATPTHTYTQKGIYTVTLTVSNADGSANTTTTVWAGYQPPSPHISTPIAGSHYNDGDTITFSGSASDAQDGTEPAGNLTWTVIFHHNTHIHAPTTFTGVSSGSFTVPVADEPSPVTWYEIDLTAKNSAGIASTTSVLMYPNTSTVTYQSNPSGAQLLLDAQPITTPYSDTSVVGFHHTLSVNSPQTIGGTSYSFSSWSNGGAQTQTFVTPASNATLTANFATSTPATQAFSSSATTDAPSYPANAPLFVTVSTTDSANLQNALVDVELWGNGTKLAQTFSNANFVAGVPVSTSWNTTAPATAGTYAIKVGIFSSDWSTLYNWNDAAGTFTVTGSTGPSYSDSVSINPANPAPGAQTTVTATVGSTVNTPNAIVDLELSDSATHQVNQLVTPVNFSANTPITIPWNFAAPTTTGTYHVKLGIFSSDWTTLYRWDDTAGTLQVGSSVPPVIPAFVISASMGGSTFAPGANATITTNVTATGDLPGVLVDTEVYDSSGSRVLQRVVNANLLANQLFSTAWNTTLPATNGTYTVKVGIFAGDWSAVYSWQNRTLEFTIGTPPPGPTPGVTYPVQVLMPSDGATVSGTEEVRAAINGLDINSYNIWWETGGGSLNDLETDPVTQAYKHAWINFDPWTWNANHQYQITFVAKDLNNNEIGSTTITVTH